MQKHVNNMYMYLQHIIIYKNNMYLHVLPIIADKGVYFDLHTKQLPIPRAAY